jgi:hypothetical protein
MYNLNGTRLALLLGEPTFADSPRCSFEKAIKTDYSDWQINGDVGTYFKGKNTGDIEFKYSSIVHGEARTFFYSDYANCNASNFYEVVNCLVFSGELDSSNSIMKGIINDTYFSDDNGGSPKGNIWVIPCSELDSEQIEYLENECDAELKDMYKVSKDLKEFGEITDFYGLTVSNIFYFNTWIDAIVAIILNMYKGEIV